MKGLGTILNVLLIILGGIIGILFGKKISKKLQDAVMVSTGIAIMFMGAGGAFEKMLTVTEGKLSAQGTMMMIISLAVGTIIGELLRIESGIVRFGEYLKRKTGNEKDANFVSAFVEASCIVCIGAMAIVGSLNDGIYGDYSVLLAKGILDLIIIAILTVSSGKGAVFSAIPVALFQGFFTLIAVLIEPFLTETALYNLSYVGSILIFCIGINQTFHKEIKVANMLPALLITAFWP